MKRYYNTVLKGTDLRDLKDVLSEDLFMNLWRIDSVKVRAWGMTYSSNGNPNKWDRLEVGDIVLFYGAGKIYFKSNVIGKIHSPDLSRLIWGKDDGKPWEYIYFLNKGEEIDVEWHPTDIGYDPAFRMRSTMFYANGSDKNMMLEELFTDESYPDLEEFISDRSTEKIEADIFSKYGLPLDSRDADRILNELSKELLNMPVKERIKISRALSRSSRFSRLVKERANYRCEICGQPGFLKTNGSRYAEAHHIMELSKTHIDNPHQMICVCPTCHRIIHYGKSEELDKRKDNMKFL